MTSPDPTPPSPEALQSAKELILPVLINSTHEREERVVWKLVEVVARAIAAKEDECQRLRDGETGIPGLFVCPKCDFILQQNIIHPGGISADTRTPPNCPNDGTEMLGLTWKAENARNMELAMKDMRRITDLTLRLSDAVGKLAQWRKAQEALWKIGPFGDAHYIDITVRRDGKDEHYQADWIKELAKMPPLDDALKGGTP